MRHVVLIAALAMGCGGDDSGEPIPIDDLQNELINAFCSLYVGCGLVEDQTTCRTVLGGFFDDNNANLFAAVEAGKVIYHPDKARECLNALAGRGCARNASFNDDPQACDDTFEGTVAAGGQCALNEECISQMCNVPGCPDACCQGTCEGMTPPTRPRLGESCSGNTNCVDSYCDRTTNICTARKADGQACSGDDDECVSGACASMVCTKLPGPADACVPSSFEVPCSHIGYTCSTMSMTCVEYGLTGDPCASNDDCSTFYRCNTTSTTCELGPTFGEPCGTQTSGSCLGNNYCDQTTMTCAAQKPVGGSCASDVECLSDNCDAATNTCVEDPICI